MIIWTGRNTSYNKHFARGTADVKAPPTIPTPAVREVTPPPISPFPVTREKSETKNFLTNKLPRGNYTKTKWEFERWTNLSDVKSFSFFFFFPFFPLFFPLFFFFWRKQKRLKVCAERTPHCIVQFPSMPWNDWKFALSGHLIVSFSFQVCHVLQLVNIQKTFTYPSTPYLFSALFSALFSFLSFFPSLVSIDSLQDRKTKNVTLLLQLLLGPNAFLLAFLLAQMVALCFFTAVSVTLLNIN